MKNKVMYVLHKMKIVRYAKVEVYLSSGQVVKFKCKEWEVKGSAPVTGQNGLQSYSFKGIKGNETIWFDISQIVAVKG